MKLAERVISKYKENPPKKESEKKDTDCWDGYERAPNTKAGEKGSCRKSENVVTENGDSDDAELLKWISDREILHKKLDLADEKLKKAAGSEKGGFGLTPDHIKNSPEFKSAKGAYDRAFKELRDFNGKAPKGFQQRASKLKRSNRRNENVLESLKKDDLKLVRDEVLSSFETEEIEEFKSFKEFFNAVDVQNAYEPDWKPNKWRPYYLAVWNELTNNKK